MDWRRFGVLAQRRDAAAPRLRVLPRLKDAVWLGVNYLTSLYFDPDAVQ
jgi:hypothetical protein